MLSKSVLLGIRGCGGIDLDNGVPVNPAEELQTARAVAIRAHVNQSDKQGSPYIDHVRRVAETVSGLGDAVVAVAWLHDVCEDDAIRVNELRGYGFRGETVQCVDALTRRRGEESPVYLDRVLALPSAATVKRADLIDNSNPERLSRLSPEEATRLRKKYALYLHALGTYSTSSTRDLIPLVDLENMPLRWADESCSKPLFVYHEFKLKVAEEAMRLVQDAARAEPTITATIQSVLPSGASLWGLDCRLKSPWRAAGKLSSLTLAGLQGGVEDINRYTVVSSVPGLS